MAGKQPTSIITENAGQFTYYKAAFSDIDDGDTWGSSMTAVVGYWLTLTDDPTTQGSECGAVAYTQSTGVFTFYPGEDSRAGFLNILSCS